MSIRIGGAILGFPVVILLVGFLGWGSAELAFFGTALLQDDDEKPISMQGNCIIYENDDKFCKNDFGLFGWKQWFSDNEVDIVEDTITKPIKILELEVSKEIQGNTTNSIIFEDEYRVCTMEQNQPPICIWK